MKVIRDIVECENGIAKDLVFLGKTIVVYNSNKDGYLIVKNTGSGIVRVVPENGIESLFQLMTDN